MTVIVADRVRDICTTTGTGNITVSGSAPSTYRTFSAVMAVADTCDLLIVHQTADEWGVCGATYSSAHVLTRGTVRSSSNAGAAVNFSAGTKDVVLIMAAASYVLPIRSLIAGSGLTGGGDLSADRTFNVGAGRGITVAGDS